MCPGHRPALEAALLRASQLGIAGLDGCEVFGIPGQWEERQMAAESKLLSSGSAERGWKLRGRAVRFGAKDRILGTAGVGVGQRGPRDPAEGEKGRPTETASDRGCNFTLCHHRCPSQPPGEPVPHPAPAGGLGPTTCAEGCCREGCAQTELPRRPCPIPGGDPGVCLRSLAWKLGLEFKSVGLSALQNLWAQGGDPGQTPRRIENRGRQSPF